MSNCDFCERAIPAGASICPNCGRPQKTSTETRSSVARLLVAIMLSVAVMLLWNALVGFPPR